MNIFKINLIKKYLTNNVFKNVLEFFSKKLPANTLKLIISIFFERKYFNKLLSISLSIRL